MNKLKSTYIKLYYRLLHFFLPKKALSIPDNLKSTKNIFLYFDYEREFSGHATDINDSDILKIIELLNNLSFKSTWFTVGKIFNNYPMSIKIILNGGHEVGSHTYDHLPPLHSNPTKLRDDFSKVSIFTPVRITGFHSPKGLWSIMTLKYLKRFGYIYDVVSVPKTKSFIPFIHHIPGFGRTIRLHTLGDDWALYQKNNNEEEVFYHFKRLFFRIGIGEIAGIGSHPWVLTSDKRILKGFSMFLKFLQAQPDTHLDTAINYANNLVLDEKR